MMPELPDVEIYRQYLNATALHHTIETVDIKAEEMLNEITAKELKHCLIDNRFSSGLRHGKYLFAQLEKGGCLVLHFGMTGFLKYFKNLEQKPRHGRLCIGFSNDYRLVYDCRRKLGEIGFTRSPKAFIRKRRLGPDVMEPDLDLDTFKKILSRSRGPVKGALMNQNMLAGLGNLYADEILFQAAVHPASTVPAMKEKTLERLFRAMREEVLPVAVERRAEPLRYPDRYIIPHRKKGGCCPNCGSELQRVKVAGRTTYLCPACQRK